jgi:hypothetical protein
MRLTADEQWILDTVRPACAGDIESCVWLGP